MTLQGQTIAVLESRAAEQVAALVARHGGKALSAPALAEIPVIHPDDMRRWMDTLAATPPAISIFQTGVGTRALLEAAAEAGVRTSLVALIQASTVVVRGPKPTAALRVAGIRIDRSASEPFTTDDVLALLEDVELTGKTVLVQRYGDFVLYKPPVKETTWLLWFGPALLLVGGLAVLVLVLRRRSKLPPEAFEPDLDDADGPVKG